MKKRFRFTLGELVIVVSIFAMLVTLGVSAVGCGPAEKPAAKKPAASRRDSAREQAHRIACSNNLKQIGTALKMFSMDYNSRFPEASGAEGLEVLRQKSYLLDGRVYICPSSKLAPTGGALTYGSDAAPANVNYAYHGGLRDGDGQSAIAADFTGEPDVKANDGKPNHIDFGNILFIDGHVSGFGGANWFNARNTGYPDLAVGSQAAVFPNRLR